MGRGQYVKLNTSLSFKRQQVDFSFTEPYFMGMPISAEMSIFATKSDNFGNVVLRKHKHGCALRTGFNLTIFSPLRFQYIRWLTVM